MERSIKEQVGAATWESWPVGARMAIADAQATIAALQAQLGDLTVKYKNLVAWYDKHNGTPCEQVRHQQEVEALQARVKELEAIKIPDDAFTYCAYCGEKSPVDEHNEDLSAHIKVCPKHPIRDVEAQLTQRTEQVAALQAQVKELEDGTSALLNQQSERLAVENEKLTMALFQLTQRTAELEALKLVNETHMKTVMKLSHIVEQSGAALDAERELSAAWAEKARQYELELDGDPQNFHGQGRTIGVREQLSQLQALVRELEAQHEDLVERNRILRHRPDLPIERTEFHDKFVELQAQLTQRTAEYQKLVEWYDKQHGTPCELVRHRLEMEEVEADLAQRTAELEALKIHCAIVEEHKVIAYKDAANLQAELERVSADNKALDKWRADVTMALQRPEGAFFVDVPQHIKDLVAELERVSLLSSHNERRFEEVDKKYKELRTLIAALPKVEGKIEVSSGVYNFILLKHDSGNRFLCGQIETEQTAKAIAALWQHRQGREGV